MSGGLISGQKGLVGCFPEDLEIAELTLGGAFLQLVLDTWAMLPFDVLTLQTQRSEHPAVRSQVHWRQTRLPACLKEYPVGPKYQPGFQTAQLQPSGWVLAKAGFCVFHLMVRGFGHKDGICRVFAFFSDPGPLGWSSALCLGAESSGTDSSGHSLGQRVSGVRRGSDSVWWALDQFGFKSMGSTLLVAAIFIYQCHRFYEKPTYQNDSMHDSFGSVRLDVQGSNSSR